MPYNASFSPDFPALWTSTTMETLWAPWRMDYIAGEREDGCVFCKRPVQRERLRENLVLHLGKLAFVILNRYPYQSAHLMVIPFRHTDAYTSLTAAESAEMTALLQASVRILTDVYRAEGINIGMNLGRCAGAGIHEHLHFHVVPRWIGDTNFFPLLAQTKSMPEMLAETYDRLRPRYRALEEKGLLASGGHPPTGTEGTARKGRRGAGKAWAGRSAGARRASPAGKQPGRSRSPTVRKQKRRRRGGGGSP